MMLSSQRYFPPATDTRLVAFTTPENYAGKLSRLIEIRGWDPLWCPTIAVETTPRTIATVRTYLQPPQPILRRFSAIAFTSRTGITAFKEALDGVCNTPPLDPDGEIFTISALGKDSELLDGSFVERLCDNKGKIRVIVPAVATPSALVKELGLGQGRKILCPVPIVIGLEEPPVVPSFLAELESQGWAAERVDAYETRWHRDSSVKGLVEMLPASDGGVDAVIFTSTAEVEGLLKSLGEMGLNWEMVRRMCPRMLTAAHGPVTAAGAERLGVGIDVVSARFDSFVGVVDALESKWKPLNSRC